jgi:GH18 family chitinase
LAGANEVRDDFFDVILPSSSLRSNLINNLIDFTNSYGFDGFNFDFEMFGTDIDTTHQENYSLLLEEAKSSAIGAKTGGGDLKVSLAGDVFQAMALEPSAYHTLDELHLMGYNLEAQSRIERMRKFEDLGADRNICYLGILFEAGVVDDLIKVQNAGEILLNGLYLDTKETQNGLRIFGFYDQDSKDGTVNYQLSNNGTHWQLMTVGGSVWYEVASTASAPPSSGWYAVNGSSVPLISNLKDANITYKDYIDLKLAANQKIQKWANYNDLCSNETIWSIREKIRIAKAMGWAGVMIWEMGQDSDQSEYSLVSDGFNGEI